MARCARQRAVSGYGQPRPEWCAEDRVRARRRLGDGRRPIPEGAPGTVRRAVGEGTRWLLVIAWDDDPGWTFVYQEDEVGRI